MGQDEEGPEGRVFNVVLPVRIAVDRNKYRQ
jgi:hypothetical protein